MNCRLPIAGCRLPKWKGGKQFSFSIVNGQWKIVNGFTLIEMLVVITILGILAALTVPALKSIGKSDAAISASRQMLDAVGHARQMAIANHTTVYMVFVPTNFWNDPGYAGNGNLTPSDRAVATNLCAVQLSAYNYISSGKVGDQPGRHSWHYLSSWQNLPQGTILYARKFSDASVITDPISGAVFPIAPFSSRADIPFPNETAVPAASGPPYARLYYVAFNYLGQLSTDGVNLAGSDEYIPLAQGSVNYAVDSAAKTPRLSGVVASSDITETPPGNSTGISYKIVHVDALTGRAVLEYHKIK
jgi:type IV fimbrial biogenesis protein FimT